MSNRAMRQRRCGLISLTYWSKTYAPNYARRVRHASRPGYGMGMGKNTLIHKGRKP